MFSVRKTKNIISITILVILLLSPPSGGWSTKPYAFYTQFALVTVLILRVPECGASPVTVRRILRDAVLLYKNINNINVPYLFGIQIRCLEQYGTWPGTPVGRGQREYRNLVNVHM